MKRSSKIIIGLIILILFFVNMFLLSCYFFRTDNGVINNLEISLGNEDKLENKNLTPITDEEASKLEPYIFKVTNNGKSNSYYKIIFQDNNDNYKKDQLLDRKQLRYQLKLNGKILITDSLENIKNNILDLRSISGGKSNIYEFRIWLDKSTMESDWMDKYFDYNISVRSVNNR